jgi:hypothetical protein
MSHLTIGSHLITPRIGYQHHGIYIGNSQVIHFTSNSTVEIVSLSEFTEDNGYTEYKFHSKFSRNEIVERAISRLGDDNYSVIFNNCEHFCNWCIHDERSSRQVRNATLNGGAAVSSVAAQHLINQAPTLAGLTLAEMTVAGGTTITSGFALLSATPVLPAALIGYGVYKAFQWLSDD